MNPACNVPPDELIAFTEEELPERRMKDLEAHVPHCPICQQRLNDAENTMSLLRETLPRPESHSRHDLLIRLYQETDRQTSHPHRSWTQAVSLTAVGATFLIGLVMLWSGIGQFVDAIPTPFQRASQDQSMQWVSDDNHAAEIFSAAPLPRTIGEDLPLYDWWGRSGIRVIVYQDRGGSQTSVEVSQFVIEEGSSPPGYMTAGGAVDGTEFSVDDPDQIQEARWIVGSFVHHLQFHAAENSDQQHLSVDQLEEIIQAFLQE